MTESTHPLRRLFRRTEPTVSAEERPVTVVPLEPAAATIAVGIAETDPLLAYLQSARGPVDVAHLDLESPALQAMREAGVVLIVPLVSQGQLIGTLNLGPRLSEQEYSSDDRRLLSTLAGHAAPAIRVAQLVREQAAEAAERERFEQEMQVATLIQQQFLPRELPDPPDWQIATYYSPARAVGGDFYDFIEMPGDRIAIVVGDVTDKGVPAALVMARTHSVLRAEASRSDSPGAILARANEILVAEMPPAMFVTCLFAILEPPTGRIVLANAGHNLPYVRTANRVVELRATGMPLGLMGDVVYEEIESVIDPGSDVLVYSDGIVEGHDQDGQMFGFPRLRDALAIDDRGTARLDRLLETLHTFTGAAWEQEDDITLVTVHRAPAEAASAVSAASDPAVITSFSLPGEEGNERLAMERVLAAIGGLGLSPARLERLMTAVSETTMNAIEYGSLGRADVPIDVVVETTPKTVVVRITDRALSGPVPPEPEAPDLALKVDGNQSPRGWGLFLIKSMVDSMDVTNDGSTQTVALTLEREEPTDG